MTAARAVLAAIGDGTPDAAYRVARSLRLRGLSNSGYLGRTNGAPTNQNIWTYSFWVKRGNLTTVQCPFGSSAGGVYDNIAFLASGSLSLVMGGGATLIQIGTNAALLDPAAWYHVLVACDLTQASPSERLKMYVNGVQMVLNGTFPAQNPASTAYATNRNGAFNNIGSGPNGATPGNFCDLTIADWFFIDGQALTPASFGAADVLGMWQPKAYAGSYGANGHYLNFVDNSATTATAIGADRSGNGNNFTPSGISVSAGVTNDSLVDSPTSYGTDTGLGNEVRGTYCVWNPLFTGSGPVNGNLDTAVGVLSRGTMRLLEFDCYWEMTAGGGSSNGGIVYATGGAPAVSVANGKTFGFRLTATGTLDYRNITDGGAWTNIATGISNECFIYSAGGAGGFMTLNCGQRPFAATAPAGYKALCTTNQPVPLIPKSAAAFDTNSRAGTGTAFSVSGKAFQPDIVWSKSRSAGTDHVLYDSARGATKQLIPDTVGAETTEPTGLTSFNANGFSGGDLAALNTSGASMVDWLWKRGAQFGIDVIAFTAAASGNQAVPHILGVIPSFVFIHSRSGTGSWWAWHKALASASTSYLALNTSNTVATQTNMWGAAGHDASNLNFGVNASLTPGATTVAFAFAEVAGFSKFGSYVGTGAADGPFVHCNFRPRFLLLKPIDFAQNWVIIDAERDRVNQSTLTLNPNTAGSEQSFSGVDLVSNGFKMRGTALHNNNGSTYTYAAFAESPFKYSRAR